MPTKTINLDDHSTVEAIPLNWRKLNSDTYAVGSEFNSHCLFANQSIVRILPFLDGKQSIREVSELAGADVNTVKLLVLQLARAGYIRSIDNNLICKVIQKTRSTSSQYQAIEVFLFFLLAFASLVFTLSSSILNQNLIPDTAGFFWGSRQSLNLLTAFLFSAISLAVHESFHFLTARAFGANPTFSISNRLFFLVAETKIKNIYNLKRWQRIAIYAAGIASEIILIAAACALKLNATLPALAVRLINQFLIIEIISILWQFLFFMKTDIYYIICEISKSYKLQEEAIDLMLLNKGGRSKLLSPSLVFYTTFMIIGTFVAFFRYFFYHLPIVFGLLIKAFTSLVISFSQPWFPARISSMADSIIIFFVETSYLSILIIVVMRKLHYKNK